MASSGEASSAGDAGQAPAAPGVAAAGLPLPQGTAPPPAVQAGDLEEVAQRLEALRSPDRPTVVIVMGMAGSGKTTVMQRLNIWVEDNGKKAYFMNLDPAVREVLFDANIDIRDTVNYGEVMKQYGLGPNGAIMTSLNLFATKFDQVRRRPAPRPASLCRRPRRGSRAPVIRPTIPHEITEALC